MSSMTAKNQNTQASPSTLLVLENSEYREPGFSSDSYIICVSAIDHYEFDSRVRLFEK
jgi:hypothetical protein